MLALEASEASFTLIQHRDRFRRTRLLCLRYDVICTLYTTTSNAHNLWVNGSFQTLGRVFMDDGLIARSQILQLQREQDVLSKLCAS